MPHTPIFLTLSTSFFFDSSLPSHLLHLTSLQPVLKQTFSFLLPSSQKPSCQTSFLPLTVHSLVHHSIFHTFSDLSTYCQNTMASYNYPTLPYLTLLNRPSVKCPTIPGLTYTLQHFPIVSHTPGFTPTEDYHTCPPIELPPTLPYPRFVKCHPISNIAYHTALSHTCKVSHTAGFTPTESYHTIPYLPHAYPDIHTCNTSLHL